MKSGPKRPIKLILIIFSSIGHLIYRHLNASTAVVFCCSWTVLPFNALATVDPIAMHVGQSQKPIEIISRVVEEAHFPKQLIEP